MKRTTREESSQLPRPAQTLRDEIFTTKEAAEYLGMALPTFQKWLYGDDEKGHQLEKMGVEPPAIRKAGVKKGHDLIFYQSDLDEFAEWLLNRPEVMKPGPKVPPDEQQTRRVVQPDGTVKRDYSNRNRKRQKKGRAKTIAPPNANRTQRLAEMLQASQNAEPVAADDIDATTLLDQVLDADLLNPDQD